MESHDSMKNREARARKGQEQFVITMTGSRSAHSSRHSRYYRTVAVLPIAEIRLICMCMAHSPSVSMSRSSCGPGRGGQWLVSLTYVP